MAVRKARWVRAWLWAVTLAVLAGATTLPIAAHAQFFGDRWGGWGSDQRYYRQPPQQRSFSFPFFGRQFSPFAAPPNRPVESFRAPPPRKPDTPPTTTVVVIGDSMADWLGYGLEEVYADQPQLGIVREIRPNSGLVHYEPRNDTLEWSQAIKDTLAGEKPAAIIVMLGLNDRLPLRAPMPAHDPKEHDTKEPAQTPQQGQQGKDGKPAAQSAPAAAPDTGEEPPAAAADQHPIAAGASYDFRTDEWAKLYGKRIGDMIAALKSKGVPVLWVGLPAIRGQRGTADMSYLDDLYHAAADRAGITYIDIWSGFVDEDGHYAVEGPDFEGQTRRLRTGDGVHFTKYGALKLAHLVDQELSHILANPTAAVAPTAPLASVPAKPAPGSAGAARPVIGPVLPLTTADGGNEHLNGIDGGNLLGGGGSGAVVSEDPTAKNVLVHGDPLNPPAGRADDFTWPPHNADANAGSPATPVKQ
jgi:uncharacterized protein